MSKVVGARAARRWVSLVVAGSLLAACGGDGDDGSTPTTTEVSPYEEAARRDVTFLADDRLQGRDNGTEGSRLAQEYLLEVLQRTTAGVVEADGPAAYSQPFPEGTNLLGVIPGTDLASEYVMVGAHYDHLTECEDLRPDDDICNGAVDNAAGTTAVLAVARALHEAEVAPRRSVLIALWDSEEDGLVGSEHYVANPLVPLEQVVTYVNIDMQGANLRPSIRNTTFAIGAETGGPRLQELVRSAVEPSNLDYRHLSLLFGQGTSDHAPFAAAGVPVVYLTDARSSCWHSDSDEVDVVDFPKLAAEIEVLVTLVGELAAIDTVPDFVAGTPPIAYEDAVELAEMGTLLEQDIDTFPEAAQTSLLDLQAQLDAIVAAGATAFSDAAYGTVAASALETQAQIGAGGCDGYLDAAAGSSTTVAAVGAIAAELAAHARAELASPEEARCIAEVVVDSFGLERLRELGFADGDAADLELTVPPMDDDEGDLVYGAYDRCLGFEQRDAAAFRDQGLSDDAARCASRHYRGSPLPREHALLRHHDRVPHTELHQRVEALWNEAASVCDTSA